MIDREEISKSAGLDTDNKHIDIIDGNMYIVLVPTGDKDNANISLYGHCVDPTLYVYALGFMNLLENETELVHAAGIEHAEKFSGVGVKIEGQP